MLKVNATILKAVSSETRTSKTGNEYEYKAIEAFVDKVGRVKFAFNNLDDTIKVHEVAKLEGQDAVLVCDFAIDRFNSPILKLVDVE